jgi:DNA replication protein DnaC
MFQTLMVLIDRLVHQAEILSLKGDSYRLRGKEQSLASVVCDA